MCACPTVSLYERGHVQVWMTYIFEFGSVGTTGTCFRHTHTYYLIFAHARYIAINERNRAWARWSCAWRMVVLPYVANTEIVRLSSTAGAQQDCKM